MSITECEFMASCVLCKIERLSVIGYKMKGNIAFLALGQLVNSLRQFLCLPRAQTVIWQAPAKVNKQATRQAWQAYESIIWPQEHNADRLELHTSAKTVEVIKLKIYKTLKHRSKADSIWVQTQFERVLISRCCFETLSLIL